MYYILTNFIIWSCKTKFAAYNFCPGSLNWLILDLKVFNNQGGCLKFKIQIKPTKAKSSNENKRSLQKC